MLEKIYDFTLIVCAFMAVFTLYLALVGTAPWHFPAIFLALYLQPYWFYYAQKALERFKKTKQPDGR
jgi:Flp pilus assembly protein TadB